MQSQVMEAAGREGVALRIDFVWRNDRYGQVISAVDAAGVATPLLESVEGSKDDAYPASPPFQSLSIESLAGSRRAALLVGMAGRSHWSGSVEPVENESAMVFDIACRVIEFGPVLASQYSVAPEIQQDARLEMDGTVWTGQHRLVVVGKDDGTKIFLPGSGLKGTVVMPARNSGGAAGTTVRWKYELRLLAS